MSEEKYLKPIMVEVLTSTKIPVSSIVSNCYYYSFTLGIYITYLNGNITQNQKF